MFKMFRKENRERLLKNIILFLTGLLISQWVFVFKDFSFIENSAFVLLVLLSINVGFDDRGDE